MLKGPASSRSARAGHLFSEPERPADVYTAHIDGAARGNPGPASYAVIVRAPDGSRQFQIGKYLGRATNNVAEYYALIGALDYAQSHQIAKLAVRSDSELLVRQMQGQYKVKSPDLRPLYERAQKMARGLAHFEILHIPRELNSEADQLANWALDQTAGGAAGAGAKSQQVAGAEPAGAPARESQTRKIRARFAQGALHPLDPLDPLGLREGEIVEISLKKGPAREPGR